MNKSAYISHNSSNSVHYEEKIKKQNNKKVLDFNTILYNFKKNINKGIYNLKEIIENNIDKSKKKEYEKIDFIINQLKKIIIKYINDLNNCFNSQYENILRAYEQKIRILYENKFNLELKKRILEESNSNLLKKEKEYELIKSKTGITVYNGKILNNDKKENEILILRKENSILKDTIERQRLDILSKGKKIQQKNAQLNKKLILKLNIKNKARQKILTNHSHPKSNSQLQHNSIIKYKQIISQKTLLNNSYTKNINTDISIRNNSSKKTKTIKSNINIKTKKSNSKNIIKKQNPNINKRINKKNRSLNPSMIGINVVGVIKDSSFKGKTPEFKNRKFFEYFNNNKNLLMIKTLNNDLNNNKGTKYFRFLSPGKGQINNYIPKAKNNFVTIKYSHSFTSKNNPNNINLQNNKQDADNIQNKNIKKIILPKIESNKTNKKLLLIKRKNDSNSKIKIRSNSRKNKSNANSKKKSNNNNIHIINNTNNNNFVNKTKNYSKKKI